MSQRDPFPMRSEAAKVLEESVEVSTSNTATASNWSTMSTSGNTKNTQSSMLSNESNEEGEAAGLMGMGIGSSKRTKTKPGDDIYAAADEEEVAAERKSFNVDDEFLDRPTYESRSRGLGRLFYQAKRAAKSIYKRLYGDQLPPEEMLRTLILASTLFFMIGGYWLLRSLKDPVLTALCGVSVIPKAKMLSVPVVLGVVSIYNHLLDSDIPKHKLFYLFGTFYYVWFTIISLLLMHPTIGLPNEQPSPWRLLGWVSYCSIESFGSVMVSLFWSFANSNISLETAKASYGVMVATAQIGSILGPTLVTVAAPKYGPAICYLIGSFCLLLLQGTMRLYISRYGVSDATAADATKGGKPKEKAGVLEGLRLFAKHNYVKGIFAISCLFMVAVTIIDYTLKVLAQIYFAEEHPCQPGASCWDALGPGNHGSSAAATAAFTAFMGTFGQATNTLSFLLSLFGTSAVIRTLGLRLTLLLFPSLVLIVIFVVRLHPTMYVAFGAMITLKACSYALNNPTKEILYQPTSPAVRYKAKSWIDIFGARGSKALGSIVTNAFSDSATNLVANGSLVGMAVASFLIWNARFMGNKFDEYTASGYIVGGSNDEDDNLAMAIGQNDNKDTSCAIYDDDSVGPEEEGQSESNGDEEEGADDDGAGAVEFAVKKTKQPEVKMV